MVLQRWLYDLKKPKAVALIKWLSKKGAEKIQEEHQQAITGRDNQIQAHQQAIEEKDTTIALLNDDLKSRDYNNIALQAQRDVYKEQLQRSQDIIAHLKKRYVPNAKDPDKGNIVMITEKSTTPEEDEFYEYLYYVARKQRRQFINTKKHGLKHKIQIIAL